MDYSASTQRFFPLFRQWPATGHGCGARLSSEISLLHVVIPNASNTGSRGVKWGGRRQRELAGSSRIRPPCPHRTPHTLAQYQWPINRVNRVCAYGDAVRLSQWIARLQAAEGEAQAEAYGRELRHLPSRD
jgi:hypothetical protein